MKKLKDLNIGKSKNTKYIENVQSNLVELRNVLVNIANKQLSTLKNVNESFKQNIDTIHNMESEKIIIDEINKLKKAKVNGKKEYNNSIEKAKENIKKVQEYI